MFFKYLQSTTAKLVFSFNDYLHVILFCFPLSNKSGKKFRAGFCGKIWKSDAAKLRLLVWVKTFESMHKSQIKSWKIDRYGIYEFLHISKLFKFQYSKVGGNLTV